MSDPKMILGNMSLYRPKHLKIHPKILNDLQNKMYASGQGSSAKFVQCLQTLGV